MSEISSQMLLEIVALLEERHGVGVRGDELPLWLQERLRNSTAAMMESRGLTVGTLLRTLEAEPELMVELANALRVGETRFYRDGAQWEALRLGVIPQLFATRTEDGPPIMGLSAGCSTGEEAWTLAMLLFSAAPRTSRRVAARVLGVDRSEAALVTARTATYHSGSEQHVPRDLRQRFLRSAVDGSVQVVPELQPNVTFQCRDLTRGAPPGRYDVIVCRNVLIYFGDEAQERLIAGLLRALTDDGVLLVARSEVPMLRSLSSAAREIAPGVTVFGK